jgi:hypothetical protein
MSHHHKNFAYSTIVTAPSPATTGTSLTIQPGDALKFPDVPFNATIWPAGVQPLSSNAEIVVVTNISEDILTLDDAATPGTRTHSEGTSARTIIVGDQIAATITAKTLADAEGLLPFWSPFILASGAASGLQTLASATSQTGTASLFVFPITIPSDIGFNQIVVPNSYSIVSSSNQNTGSNTYYSRYGIYSMNANTLSLISSSWFSICESLAAANVTWNFPTTTATSDWGYGNLSSGASSYLTAAAQFMSLVGSLRSVGLHFGGDVLLTGGVYWLGLLSQRSTAGTAAIGLSHAGIIGQPINVVNQAGSVNGLNPMGIAASQWTIDASHVTGWWGRYIAGFITATSLANFGGTAIPSYISLSALQGVAAASTVTILPSVTFVST